MVLSRLGRPTTEDAICADLHGTRHGYDLRAVAPILGGVYDELPFELRTTYKSIQIDLQNSHWFIVTVFTGELAKVVQAMKAPPVSRFRALSPRGLHAVVLVGAVDERFYYLDPYYPAAGQPFSMSRTEFRGAFAEPLVKIRLIAPGSM
jgi:hypothetical protein